MCQYFALAADLDGAFAMARMQPCFQVAVKIATVVAARPRGGSHVGSLASTAAWAGQVLRTLTARVPQFRYPVSVRLAVSGWAGMCRPVRSCPGS